MNCIVLLYLESRGVEQLTERRGLVIVASLSKDQMPISIRDPALVNVRVSSVHHSS